MRRQCFGSLMGLLIALISATCVRADTLDKLSQGTPAQGQDLSGVYTLISNHPFVYNRDEVEAFGEKALALSGDARIYALWRVLYVYKISQNRARLQAWHDRISDLAQSQGDSNLDLLARFMMQAYDNEARGFSIITDREWDTYLSAPDEALQYIAMVEKERQLQYHFQWADAIDFGHALIVRLDAAGPSARALLLVVHQSMAYNMFRVGDAEAYAGHMLSAVRLSQENTFFLQKMDMLYDLTFFAAKRNDMELAQNLEKLYSGYVEKYNVAELRVLGNGLCATVAFKVDQYNKVLECLKDEPVIEGKVVNGNDTLNLMMLVTSEAKLGNIPRTQFYLSKLKALPSTLAPPDDSTRDYVEAQIKADQGDYPGAFKALDKWSKERLITAENYRINSIQGMYKALRKELDSKTEESRLLAKQVQMRNLLLSAAGVIALLLTVIVTGGAFWVMRMRRLHASLNEAHEHAEAANAAKSRFLAVMSHELRTPLNGVLGMAQALKSNDLNPSQLEQVDILVDSGKTLMALLNDVLDMSRIEAGKIELAPSPASLKDTVERVINTYSPLARDKNLTLRYDLDDSAEPVMLFDVLRVYQCLSNLVANAVKFTEKGSVRIRISAEMRKGGGYTVRCEVRDTGIGMSKAVMDRLFEAYSQADAMTARRYGGSGLGLSISRRLAELMGGTLSVTSQEGEGSTFVMTFKAGEVLQEAPHAIETSAVILAEEDDSLPGLHILLVDDHPVNRKVARLFLEPFGFIITEAADGQEALDLDMSRFDLVLMDLNMPKLGGLEATRIFRASESPDRHLPIIALTADAMKDQVEACYAAGMDAHLAKPIVMDVLIDTVARLLHLHDQDTAEVA